MYVHCCVTYILYNSFVNYSKKKMSVLPWLLKYWSILGNLSRWHYFSKKSRNQAIWHEFTNHTNCKSLHWELLSTWYHDTNWRAWKKNSGLELRNKTSHNDHFCSMLSKNCETFLPSNILGWRDQAANMNSKFMNFSIYFFKNLQVVDWD